MKEQESARSLDRRVLRLTPGFDPDSMRPSSVEFFLVSRIDGCTPWRVLREMGGMTAEESDLCLESWLAAGYVEVSHSDQGIQNQDLSSEGRAVEAALAIDPSLDLDVATQERVIELRALLDGPDHRLLGVPSRCDEKSIKRAYFKLSREFHPDRFFRRDLGAYRPEVEKLFKAIQRAYVNLSEPPSRSPLSTALSGNQAAGAGLHEERGPERRAVHDSDSSDPEKHERYQKARELMKAAAEAVSEGRLHESLKCLQIAEKFSPDYPSLTEAMADVVTKLKQSGDGEARKADSRLRRASSGREALRHRRAESVCRGET
jgi:hypothetical protein